MPAKSFSQMLSEYSPWAMQVGATRCIRPVFCQYHLWTYEMKEESKARLYDPETGEYLNDKTMKAIEDVCSGKDKGTTYASFEEFEKAMRAL